MTTARIKAYYSDTFKLPLPRSHRFPIDKYRLLRESLLASPLSDRLEFCLPAAATDQQLLLVHTAEYLDQLKQGTLSKTAQRRIGFPWSPGMVERSRRSTGATIAAARAARREGSALHLAGGTHHAFPGHGQGFCVFNDVAVAIRVLQSEQLLRRAVVIDLDVHQGNGTAAIFTGDADIFTFSMHGAHNFPFAKCDGDLDVPLADGTRDEPYLSALRDALLRRLPLDQVDMAFYLAGADPYQHDRFGKLKLTKAGLRRRDRLVLASCRQSALPVVVVMAGGYARTLQDIVDINMATVHALLDEYAPSASAVEQVD